MSSTLVLKVTNSKDIVVHNFLVAFVDGPKNVEMKYLDLYE